MNTTDTQFSTREVPWMKMGKLLEKPVTAAEATRLGGLDFTVSKRQIRHYEETTGRWLDIDNRVAVVRDDTSEFFEVVGANYTPLQYAEAFDFMDAIHPKFVAAGTLRGGRQGFLVVQPDRMIAPGGDKVEMFVILRTSHDRSRGVEISIMPLRGLCMNQLTLRSFTRDVNHRWSITHTTNLPTKLHEAQHAMAQLDAYTKSFQRLAERLMISHPTEKHVREVLSQVIRHGGKKREDEIDKIVTLWHDDTERVGYNDTSWGLVNAVSEYLEWQRRSRHDNVESRFLMALQGYTHSSINRTAQLILAA